MRAPSFRVTRIVGASVGVITVWRLARLATQHTCACFFAIAQVVVAAHVIPSLVYAPVAVVVNPITAFRRTRMDRGIIVIAVSGARRESITVAFDARQPNAGARSIGVGIEVLTLQSFLLRGGYTSQGDLGNGLRLGAGVRFKTIQVDYAFASVGALGAAHRFGLTLRFAPPKENPVFTAQRSFAKGMKEYDKKRFTEALVAAGIMDARYLRDENGLPMEARREADRLVVKSTGPNAWEHAWQGLDARR